MQKNGFNKLKTDFSYIMLGKIISNGNLQC